MTAPDLSLDGRLGELLEHWRCDIRSVPVPTLVDLATAVAIVRGARHRAGASPDEAPTRWSEV
jgi:hypothetical protein